MWLRFKGGAALPEELIATCLFLARVLVVLGGGGDGAGGGGGAGGGNICCEERGESKSHSP